MAEYIEDSGAFGMDAYFSGVKGVDYDYDATSKIVWFTSTGNADSGYHIGEDEFIVYEVYDPDSFVNGLGGNNVRSRTDFETEVGTIADTISAWLTAYKAETTFTTFKVKATHYKSVGVADVYDADEASNFSLTITDGLYTNSDGNFILRDDLFAGNVIEVPVGIYVATDGDNTNGGTSPSDAYKTVTHALTQAFAGDTIYVKAGLYPKETLVINNKSGTVGNPITIQGYQTTPEDVPDLGWSFPDNTDFDSTVMPLMDGGDHTGTGLLVVAENYIDIRNFQFINYGQCVNIDRGSNCNIQNIHGAYLGIPGSATGGVVLMDDGSHYNTVDNCTAYNSSTASFRTSGTYNDFTNITAIFDEEYYESDYMIEVRGYTSETVPFSADYNTVTDCYIEKAGTSGHSTHGFAMKGVGQFNVFDNCNAHNITHPWQARYFGCKNNTWQNSTATADGIPTNKRTGGINISEGANNNTFDNLTVTDTSHALLVGEGSEDEPAQGVSCADTTITNCTFTNMGTYPVGGLQHSFLFAEATAGYTVRTERTTFTNCIFDSADYLFSGYETGTTEGEGSDNQFIDCDFIDIPDELGNTLTNWGFCWDADCTQTNSNITFVDCGGSSTIPDPIHRWVMDGNSNDDGATGGLNGVDTNVTYSATNAKFGQAVDFTGGAGSYVVHNYTAEIDIEFAVSFYVTINTITNTPNRIMSFGSYVAFFADEDGGSQYLCCNNGTNASWSSRDDTPIQLGKIYHVGINFKNGDYVPELYIDGVLKDVRHNDYWGGNPLFGLGTTAALSFDGSLDQVEIYDRWLTDAEFLELSNRTSV